MDESKEVSTVETCMIAPSTPSTRQELFLSSLDILWTQFHYNRRLLFYSTQGYQEQDSFIATLKESLAMVLVHFYPAAGRLSLSQDMANRVCIDCNDAGVEFIVAISTSPDLNELQTHDFQPCPFFNKLASFDVHPSSEIFNLPLLSIQVTRLSSSGIVLGYAHSHVLADGHSMWHFMNSWAECARKEPISLIPLHMRTLLGIKMPSEEKASLLYPPEGLSICESLTGPPVVSKEPLFERYFQCSGAMIERLKRVANCACTDSGGIDGIENPAIDDNTFNSEKIMDGKYCKEDTGKSHDFTSYEAMCAYWWKRITWARGLKDQQVVRFGVLANMRSRLLPKLPPSYFGNAVIVAYTYAPAAEILQESLAHTAARIHEASIALSEDCMWGMIHWLELHGHFLDSKYWSNVPGLRTVSSSRFRVYDVDYGYGRPLAVRTAKTKGDGEMVLFPPRDGHKGGVDICLPLTHMAMVKLLDDPLLCLT